MPEEELLQALKDLVDEVIQADNWEDQGLSRMNWAVLNAQKLIATFEVIHAR